MLVFVQLSHLHLILAYILPTCDNIIISIVETLQSARLREIGCSCLLPVTVLTRIRAISWYDLLPHRATSDFMWTAVQHGRRRMLTWHQSLATTIYWNSILLWWPHSNEVGLMINLGLQTPCFQQFHWRGTAYRWRHLLFAHFNDTIRDAILTCAWKPTWVSLIYHTEVLIVLVSGTVSNDEWLMPVFTVRWGN